MAIIISYIQTALMFSEDNKSFIVRKHELSSKVRGAGGVTEQDTYSWCFLNGHVMYCKDRT